MGSERLALGQDEIWEKRILYNFKRTKLQNPITIPEILLYPNPLILYLGIYKVVAKDRRWWCPQRVAVKLKDPKF